MKVLQVNAVYGVGSTGMIVRDIQKMCLNAGIESYVAYSTSPVPKKEIPGGYAIGNMLGKKLHALLYRINRKQAYFSRYATYRFLRYIKQLKPDVVHLHNLHSNYINLPMFLKFLGEHEIPTLVTLHDCWFYTGGCTYHQLHACEEWERSCTNCPSKKLKRVSSGVLAERKALFSSMKFLAVNGVSKWTANDAKRSVLESANPITHIYNWIDLEVFQPQNSREAVRKRYQIPENHKLLLGVSQGWSKRKGLDEFLYLSEQMKDSVTIILVGSCAEPIVAENIQCIGFTKNRQELVELYSAADVFVNPSRMETFGLVTAEAMACGTPVVAYNNTGTAEILPEMCGGLAPDGNMEALAGVVEKVLTKGKERYSQHCVDWAKQSFDKEQQIHQYIALYEKLEKTKSERKG